MTMKWFRLYHSVLNSPKVQRLPDSRFKLWINLLVVASERKQRGTLPSISDIAFKVRLCEEEVTEQLAALNACGLVRYENGCYVIHEWDTYQSGADDSGKRVAKHRAARKDVTEQPVTSTVTAPVTCPVTVTPQSREEQNRTEQIPQTPTAVAGGPGPVAVPKPEPKRRHAQLPEVEQIVDEVASRIHDRHPKPRSCALAVVLGQLRAICALTPAAQRIAQLDRIDADHAAWCGTEDWAKEGGRFAKGLENWLAPTKRRWDGPPPPGTPKAVPVDEVVYQRSEEITARFMRELAEETAAAAMGGAA